MATVKQNTTDIPSEVIAAIADLVCPAGAARYVLHLTNKPNAVGVSGWAYRNSGRVSLCIGTLAGPHVYNAGGNSSKGYLHDTACGSRAEAVLFVLAHELRHRFQRAHRQPRVYGSRGRYSERDADAYALNVLRRYRRGEIAGLDELMRQIPAGLTPAQAIAAANEREAAKNARARAADTLAELPKRIRDLLPAGTTRVGMCIDAPRGYVWRCNECHVIYFSSLNGLRRSRWVEKCEDPDCGVCEPGLAETEQPNDWSDQPAPTWPEVNDWNDQPAPTFTS